MPFTQRNHMENVDIWKLLDMSAQCNDCHFKYPIRINLRGHLAMKHGVFEDVLKIITSSVSAI